MAQTELTLSFESSFPSSLHYKLAKEFGEAFYGEFSGEIEALRHRYGLASGSALTEPITDLEERVRQITAIGAVVVVLRSELEGYRVGIERKGRIRRDLREKGITLGDITRAIEFLHGFAHVRDYAIQTAEKTIGVYASYIGRAMEMAGSGDEQTVREAISMESFRHEAIRATHPTYGDAVDFYSGNVELTRRLLNFLREFRAAVPETPRLQLLRIESKAPTQEVFDFIDGMALIYGRALAKVYGIR